MDFPALVLKKGEERRLRAGHLWVFSNEVDTDRSPLSGFEPGQRASILASNGRLLGSGYVNPRALLCARLIERGGSRVLDAELFSERIRKALTLRERLFAAPYYRLVFSEADALPGLIVDRYADVLVAQIGTAGMERCIEPLCEALAVGLGPSGVLLRNDALSRGLEGLPSYVRTACGRVPEEITLPEEDLKFLVPLHGGQKTGWYFDQQSNRLRMRRYASGRRVLDVFSYVGGFGLHCAAAGAQKVVCIESSPAALAYLERNARLNRLAGQIEIRQGDAFERLKEARARGDRYDAVVLDPPAFIQRRKDREAGLLAYRRLIQGAIGVLHEDGILLAASCSYHLDGAALLDQLRRSALRSGRGLQVLEHLHQSPDHPVHPAIPETDYLKGFICRVM
ncbi:MAG: class I SAM-dependent rRNA methyltransferase [Gammaproteobacteria bacterium]